MILQVYCSFGLLGWVIRLGWAVGWFVNILIIHFAKEGRSIPGMYLLFCSKLKNGSSCEYDRCI